MDVVYRCPRCQQQNQAPVDPQGGEFTCAGCGLKIAYQAEDVSQGRLRRCLVCPSDDLYVRKDFPQKLGFWIVVLGFAASCVTWYFRQVVATFAILFGTAGLDLLLYLFFGNVLTCYRCHALYRGVENLEEHGPFDLEVHERHRQIAARLQQQAESQPSELTAGKS